MSTVFIINRDVIVKKNPALYLAEKNARRFRRISC